MNNFFCLLIVYFCIDYQKLEAEFIIKQTKEFVNNAENVYDDIIGW